MTDFINHEGGQPPAYKYQCIACNFVGHLAAPECPSCRNGTRQLVLCSADTPDRAPSGQRVLASQPAAAWQHTFRVGDVVRLKSGGPKMTVVTTDLPGRIEPEVRCIWHAKNGQACASDVPVVALVAVPALADGVRAEPSKLLFYCTQCGQGNLKRPSDCGCANSARVPAWKSALVHAVRPGTWDTALCGAGPWAPSGELSLRTIEPSSVTCPACIEAAAKTTLTVPGVSEAEQPAAEPKPEVAPKRGYEFL